MAKDPADRPPSAGVAEMLREVQARAGFDRTPIPATQPGALASPVPPPSAAPSPLVAAVPEPWPAAPPQHDGAASTTVVRRQPVAPRAPPAGAPAPSGRRVWIGVGAAAAAIVAIAAGIVVLGGGSDDPAPETTVAVSPPPDTFFDTLASPSNVTVIGTGDGTFAVDATPVDGASSYEIEPVGAAGDPVVVNGFPVTIDGRGASSLCVVIRALGGPAESSRDSDPACS